MNITNVITVLHVWVPCIVTSLPAVRFTTSAQARLPWLGCDWYFSRPVPVLICGDAVLHAHMGPTDYFNWTLYVLNFSEGTSTYIYILCHYST